MRTYIRAVSLLVGTLAIGTIATARAEPVQPEGIGGCYEVRPICLSPQIPICICDQVQNCFWVCK